MAEFIKKAVKTPKSSKSSQNHEKAQNYEKCPKKASGRGCVLVKQ